MPRGLGRWWNGLVARGGADDAGRWLAIDEPSNGYYTRRLMRFRARGDLVRYPDHVWSDTGDDGRPGGLLAHLEETAERLDGAIYADVLIVLNQEDRRRSLDRGPQPWHTQLQALVDAQVTRRLAEGSWHSAVPGRPLQLQIVGDGEPAMGGHPLGLGGGEYATALLPNLYLGPIAGSRALAEVFVRVPRQAGGRGGFRAVGTFFDDQLAFTIGRHWLDNGRDEALPAAALYTLHRLADDDAMHHRLNADLADRFRLDQQTTARGDTVTVRAADGDGEPVLEVMLLRAAAASPRTDAGRGRETLIPEELPPAGEMTMIPEPEPDPVVVLSRRGALLQKVHFGRVMRGYRLDLGADGSVAPLLADPVARIRVERDTVALEPRRGDLSLDGQPLPPGIPVPLPGPRHTIAFSGVSLVYQAAARAADPRWPYLGELTVPAEPFEAPLGGRYRIGRDRRKCEIALPDRAVTENILWHPSVDRDGTIRVHGGEVPARSFTTDSILVASRHAEVDLHADEPLVRALSAACAVFVRRRDGSVLRLVAREGATAVALRQGDDLLVGNAVFRVVLPGAYGVAAGERMTHDIGPPAGMAPPRSATAAAGAPEATPSGATPPATAPLGDTQSWPGRPPTPPEPTPSAPAELPTQAGDRPVDSAAGDPAATGSVERPAVAGDTPATARTPDARAELAPSPPPPHATRTARAPRPAGPLPDLATPTAPIDEGQTIVEPVDRSTLPGGRRRAALAPGVLPDLGAPIAPLDEGLTVDESSAAPRRAGRTTPDADARRRRNGQRRD